LQKLVGGTVLLPPVHGRLPQRSAETEAAVLREHAEVLRQQPCGILATDEVDVVTFRIRDKAEV
jgi:hypothetical protein